MLIKSKIGSNKGRVNHSSKAKVVFSSKINGLFISKIGQYRDVNGSTRQAIR
jgi:hypothetical protein